MRRLTLRVALGCVLLLGIALGCGDDGAHDDQPVGDACGLITKAEADAILGTSVTLRPETKSGWSECGYEGPGGAGFSLKVYWSGGKEEMSVTKSAMNLAPAVMEDNGMEPAGMLALHPVSGLGDEAYFNPIAGSYVRKGDVLLEFDLRMLLFQAPTQEAAVAQWRSLVEKALDRL